MALLVQAAAWSVPPAGADPGGGPPPGAPEQALPAVPPVPSAVTDGVPATELLSRALDLSSHGSDQSALLAHLAATQAQLDHDAARAAQARAAAAAATREADSQRRAADAAQQRYDHLKAAVRSAVVYLYTAGPQALVPAPGAGPAGAYAATYAESTFTPYGVLVRSADAASAYRRTSAAATSAQRRAVTEESRRTQDLAALAAQVARLRAEVQSAAAGAAAALAGDRLTLAQQARTELSGSRLDFPPAAPLPAPVPTTGVALTWAFAELGKPYVWGATGPDSFDCSGLTQFVWHQAGVDIPRVAADQDAWTVPVPLSQLLPGDLVFFGTTDIHHVGIYIGSGLMINAPHTGDVVRVSSIWWSDLAGFGRVHFAGTPVPPHQPPTAKRPAPPVVTNAAPVPSQTQPPPGWRPGPGATAPIDTSPPADTPVPAGTGPTTSSGATTTVPAPTSTVPVDPPSIPAPSTTTTTATTVARSAGTTTTTTSSLP
ncbi:MAG TPA: NlpC/P60 family protein [Acidimicrobiales bacterium]|nr:NlpC/P60 family protein [Acidimicrobiales bacterium]